MKVISDALLQKKLGFTPHAGQAEILKGMKRFTTIAAGRRFGKSELCAYLALRELLATKRKIWVVAPTYDLTKKTTNYMLGWIAKSFPTFFSVTMAPNVVIRSKSGSILESKTSDNMHSLMGEELDLCIVDEASAMPKIVWEQYLYPTLTIRKGKAVAISTPKGQNWFYQLFNRAHDRPELYSSFQYESRINPLVSSEEWDEAERSLPALVFQQEYQALFLSDAAAVFRDVYSNIENTLAEPKDTHQYIMGVDLGKHQDFTVIVVIDLINHHVVHIDRFNQISWPLQKERIINVARKYKDALINIDSTGKGDPISDDLSAEGLSVQDFCYSNTSKTKLITKLSMYIEQGRVKYPENQVLLDELSSFGYKRTQFGKFVYGPQEGGHDDCVNALALAVWELPEECYEEVTENSEVLMFPSEDY